jgi:hypothetical protein
MLLTVSMYESNTGSTATLRPVPKAKRTESDLVKTTVELPADLWRAAKIRAMDERSDLKTIFIRALEAFLNHRPAPTLRRDRN